MLRKGGPLATPAGSGMRPVQPTTIVEPPTSGSPPPSSTSSMMNDSMQPTWGASSDPTDDHQHASLPAYMDAPRSSSFESASPASAEPTIIQLDDVAAPASADEDGVAIMTGDISKDGSSMRSRGSTAPADKPEKIHLTPPTARRMQKQAAAGRMPDPDDDFDPVEEFLSVLPPPLARLLVNMGKKLNPSGMQIVGVKKDLKEDPKGQGGGDTIYNTNKTQHLIAALSVGLKPHGLALAVAFVVWILTQLISPSFFLYPFFHLEFSGIFSSWGLFFWGGLFSGAVWYFRGRDVKTYGRPYLLKAANSLIIATAEEFGFRFLYICFAMVAMALFNVLIENIGLYLGALMILLGLVVGVIALLYMLGALKEIAQVKRIMKRYNPIHVVVGSGILVAAGMLVLVLGLVWGALFTVLFDWVVFPVANVLTGYQYDQFFMGAFGMNAGGYEGPWAGSKRRRKIWQQNAVDNRMFMVGVLLANVFYRDGRKFQGVVGWIHSLYVGFALANAMTSHGLLTALAVHLLYDAQYFLAGYLVNKYCKKRRPTLDEM